MPSDFLKPSSSEKPNAITSEERNAIFKESLKDDNVFVGEAGKPLSVEELASKCQLTLRPNFTGSQMIIEGTTETGKKIKIKYGAEGATLLGQVEAWLNDNPNPVSPESAKYLLSVYKPVAELLKNDSKI